MWPRLAGTTPDASYSLSLSLGDALTHFRTSRYRSEFTVTHRQFWTCCNRLPHLLNIVPRPGTLRAPRVSCATGCDRVEILHRAFSLKFSYPALDQRHGRHFANVQFEPEFSLYSFDRAIPHEHCLRKCLLFSWPGHSAWRSENNTLVLAVKAGCDTPSHWSTLIAFKKLENVCIGVLHRIHFSSLYQCEISFSRNCAPKITRFWNQHVF